MKIEKWVKNGEFVGTFYNEINQADIYFNCGFYNTISVLNNGQIESRVGKKQNHLLVHFNNAPGVLFLFADSFKTQESIQQGINNQTNQFKLFVAKNQVVRYIDFYKQWFQTTDNVVNVADFYNHFNTCINGVKNYYASLKQQTNQAPKAHLDTKLALTKSGDFLIKDLSVDFFSGMKNGLCLLNVPMDQEYVYFIKQDTDKITFNLKPDPVLGLNAVDLWIKNDCVIKKIPRKLNNLSYLSDYEFSEKLSQLSLSQTTNYKKR